MVCGTRLHVYNYFFFHWKLNTKINRTKNELCYATANIFYIFQFSACVCFCVHSLILVATCQFYLSHKCLKCISEIEPMRILLLKLTNVFPATFFFAFANCSIVVNFGHITHMCVWEGERIFTSLFELKSNKHIFTVVCLIFLSSWSGVHFFYFNYSSE